LRACVVFSPPAFRQDIILAAECANGSGVLPRILEAEDLLEDLDDDLIEDIGLILILEK
jgi:hypothetical protein